MRLLPCLLLTLALACASSDSKSTTDTNRSSETSTNTTVPTTTGTDTTTTTTTTAGPVCEAVAGALCYYVAVDGDDLAPGTIEAPFKKLQTAVVLAQPGDFIYVRGGRYGIDNAAVTGARRLPQDTFTSPCAADQFYEDNYCQVPKINFASLGDWNGYPVPNNNGYSVADGVLGTPITLRNYPGETPILDMAPLAYSADVEQVQLASQRDAISITKSHWVVQGFEIVAGSIDLRGNIENITIESCEIHGLVRDGGDNPGLIRLNRGPEDVYILNNTLYDISDVETPGVWDSTAEDSQHFGAVTTLSGETYGGTDGTGAIEIRGNTIYNVPQAFFFKNAAEGPIDVVDNRIYDSGSLASNVSANVRFAGNLITGVRQGVWRQGQGFTEQGTLEAAVLAIDGQNLTFEYNTFVGLEDTLVRMNYGEGHQFNHNVFFGLPGITATAGWNTGAYLKVNDPAATAMQGVTSDDNCFAVPDADFQFVASYGGRVLGHYSLATSQATFAVDANSVVVLTEDLGAVFVDAAAGDYGLIAGSPCVGMGHTALP